MNNFEGNTKIHMIGAIHECPVRERDAQCCYKPFLNMELKTVAETINDMSQEERQNLVKICRLCSIDKQKILQNFHYDKNNKSIT